jgi:hypothetical protein
MVYIVLLAESVLAGAGFGASMQLSGGRGYLLPWEMIAKKFHEANSFHGNEGLLDSNMSQHITVGVVTIDPSGSYAHRPNQAITIRLPAGSAIVGSLGKIGINLAKYAKNSWQQINDVSASTEPDTMKVTGGIAEEGFFRLSCAMRAQNGERYNSEAYAIVCGNWKKDILAFSRTLKEQIELDPDAQLLRSCIATSHFDNAMEVISKASVLSDEVLRVLSEAVRSKQDFDAGKCPDLVIGLNKIRLKRFEGSPVEEFVVFIPDSYAGSKAWPVFVHPDIRRWATKDNYSLRSGLIDLWWHTISYKDIRWKDYTIVMETIEQKLNIDKDRIYVDGECRNGLDAAALALNYPDQWAECSISLGNSYRYLAGNALNLPLVFVKGAGNIEGSYVGFYNYTVKCFQYHGCGRFKHSKTQSTVQARGTPIPEAVREKSPRRVLYTIESLAKPKAYWVKIDGREDENLLGTIDASVDGQKILVKTSNVDAYSLDLVRAPLDSSKPVEILEDGQSLGFVTEPVFTKRSEKYIDTAFIKNDQLHGPVWDAFTDPYVVVYGTGGGDVPFVKTCKDIAEELAHGASCFADVEMPKKTASEHNLILVGSVGSNRWLARISEKLPVQMRQGRIHTTNGKFFNGNDLAYVVIHPNPMNPDKYVVVYSATSDKAMATMLTAYSQMKTSIPADVGIYEVTKQGGITWHVLERLNTVWNWHGEYEKALTVVGRNHPKWQWRQWVAHVVKKQMRVDVVICEDHLRNLDALSPGEKTYRDLFNAFQNAWFTKVNMDGKSLRAVLMVPFGSISKREVDAPIIDGICLIKNPTATGAESLAINELGGETIYTVAFSEKCLNGQRMGLVLQDYDIVDQKYLMPMLKEYLISNSESNVDGQLDSLKFNIY